MAASERPHGAHGSGGRKPHTLLAAEARLRSNPYPALRTVACGYRKGVLTLRGRLASEYLKQLAQDAVAQVQGVERVENLIEVITAPARKRGPRAGSALPRAAPPQPAGQAAAAQTKTRRVLVVGDRPEAVEHWALELGEAGHRVRRTCHNSEALALAAEFQPEVVVVCLALPGRYSYHLGAQLRLIPGLNEALLIALTAQGTEPDHARVHALAFDHHLTEPVEAGVLLHLLA